MPRIAKPSPGQQLLEFKDVTVVKGRGAKVLDRVTLSIFAGENVAILGPNGSGKSSLIKTITREYYPQLEPHTVFKVWGSEQWDVFALRNLLGVVTGELQYALSKDIPARDVVVSGFFSSIGLYKQRVTSAMRRKTAAAFRFLGISHLASRSMVELSSGEARLVLIARALAHQPRALILDEPSNSLDVRSLEVFRGLLRKITRSGTSVILVTHQLGDIIPEIRRIIMIKEGRIMMDGSREQCLTPGNLSRLFGIKVSAARLLTSPGFRRRIPHP